MPVKMGRQRSPFDGGSSDQLTLTRWIGLQGRLARPFLGVMGGWAVWCGALASNQVRWNGQGLLSLALVVVLADQAWGSLWDLATGIDWFHLLGQAQPRSRLAFQPLLPYTSPSSPAGRLSLGRTWFTAWWRRVLWPAAGPAVLGLIAAVALTVILSLLLPARLRPLNAAFVALIGLGMFQRKQGQAALAAQALVQVGLGWLAGHLAFSEMTPASLALALLFSLSACGALWAARGPRGYLWLLNGGLIASVAALILFKNPLAAGVTGLLFFGVVASQLPQGGANEPVDKRRWDRLWPWLMAGMFVAALAVP